MGMGTMEMEMEMEMGGIDEVSAKHDHQVEQVHRRQADARGGEIPLVMMLEPLHACNLTCTGCGRIREYKDTITEQITVEQCLKAVDECGSPIVSICGGEPMIYRRWGNW
jgi:MoaA/NifB/PqqE/SkfB family radical SAM enzyme